MLHSRYKPSNSKLAPSFKLETLKLLNFNLFILQTLHFLNLSKSRPTFDISKGRVRNPTRDTSRSFGSRSRSRNLADFASGVDAKCLAPFVAPRPFCLEDYASVHYVSQDQADAPENAFEHAYDNSTFHLAQALEAVSIGEPYETRKQIIDAVARADVRFSSVAHRYRVGYIVPFLRTGLSAGSSRIMTSHLFSWSECAAAQTFYVRRAKSLKRRTCMHYVMK